MTYSKGWGGQGLEKWTCPQRQNLPSIQNSGDRQSKTEKKKGNLENGRVRGLLLFGVVGVAPAWLHSWERGRKKKQANGVKK